ncbi:MAG: lysine exporter LysO family protein [Nitrososphaerota archaeon]|nr:lysine exporter LysO family protein [Candidatus Bathyarchaeota archaeon]MDW8023555.1 lysine exporter LysO family protein [Nitrososphaerota archaeon]
MMRWILAALFTGALAGYLNNNFGVLALNDVFSGHVFDLSLIALLFVMGWLFGADKEALAKLRKKGFKILAFPTAISLGSIFGGFVGGMLLGTNVYASMGVCAGYGWYTLTGPLAGQLFGMEWGALGFAVNFLRELATITMASVVRKIDRYAPIAMGGATAMDTTLPVILRVCGQDALIEAFSSGFILTLIAPFAITTIASIAH